MKFTQTHREPGIQNHSKIRASHTHGDLHLPLSALIGFFDLTVLLLCVDSPETVLPLAVILGGISGNMWESFTRKTIGTP